MGAKIFPRSSVETILARVVQVADSRIAACGPGFTTAPHVITTTARCRKGTADAVPPSPHRQIAIPEEAGSPAQPASRFSWSLFLPNQRDCPRVVGIIFKTTSHRMKDWLLSWDRLKEAAYVDFTHLCHFALPPHGVGNISIAPSSASIRQNSPKSICT